MTNDICYEKDAGKREKQKSRDVKYDCCDKEQHYAAVTCDKKVEDRCHVKYAAVRAADKPAMGRSKSCVGRRRAATACSSVSYRSHRDSVKCKSPAKRSKSSSCDSRKRQQSVARSCTASKSSRSRRRISPMEVAAKCYEVKREMRFDPCGTTNWQNGKYCRDDCGSGIVPAKFAFLKTRDLWCKTPLTMYQATIGELARKLLCREIVLKRDVRPGPPCNICEDVLPPCRGYYRKYDCLRPCEEELTYTKRGVKHYRNRLQRYWEPCMSKEQKHTIDINSYAPHNSALALKMRRQLNAISCW